MMQPNTVRYSTCACVIDYEWDDTLPAASRVHTLLGFEAIGIEHVGLSGKNLFNIIVAENNTNSTALALTAQAKGIVASVDLSGLSLTQRKAHDEAFESARSWVGTGASRVLTLDAGKIGLTAIQQTTLQTLADTTLGAGKVSVKASVVTVG